MQLGLFDHQRYPTEPGHQRNDTSLDAAKEIKPSVRNLRDKVRILLQYEDLTADECAELLEMSVLAIRPRLTELKEIGDIIDTGKRRKNKSRRNAIVWGKFRE